MKTFVANRTGHYASFDFENVGKHQSSGGDFMLPLLIVVLALLTIAMQTYLTTSANLGHKIKPAEMPIYTEVPFASR